MAFNDSEIQFNTKRVKWKTNQTEAQSVEGNFNIFVSDGENCSRNFASNAFQPAVVEIRENFRRTINVKQTLEPVLKSLETLQMAVGDGRRLTRLHFELERSNAVDRNRADEPMYISITSCQS